MARRIDFIVSPPLTDDSKEQAILIVDGYPFRAIEMTEELRELNRLVEDALAPVEPCCRSPLIQDIKARRGYRDSRLFMCMCRTAYYRRKRHVLTAIALGMGLE